MKNRDLIESVESINAIASYKQTVRTSFAIALNLKSIKDHLDIFNDQRKLVVEKHTKKDEDGKAVPVYENALDAVGKLILDEKGQPTPAMDGEGKPKTLDGQVKLIDPKEFQKDLDELLDVDVTNDLRIRKIKLTDLTGSVEPHHLVNLLWMIQDDVYEPGDRAAEKAVEKSAKKVKEVVTEDEAAKD